MRKTYVFTNSAPIYLFKPKGIVLKKGIQPLTKTHISYENLALSKINLS